MKILVTGCGGLIGSSVAAEFASEGHRVVGIDNNSGPTSSGPQGDTRWNQRRLAASLADLRAP